MGEDWYGPCCLRVLHHISALFADERRLCHREEELFGGKGKRKEDTGVSGSANRKKKRKARQDFGEAEVSNGTLKSWRGKLGHDTADFG